MLGFDGIRDQFDLRSLKVAPATAQRVSIADLGAEPLPCEAIATQRGPFVSDQLIYWVVGVGAGVEEGRLGGGGQ